MTLKGIKRFLIKYKYNEKAALSIFFFVLLVFATNQIILSLMSIYHFHRQDVYYSLFSIIVVTLVISLSEKLIAKRYHAFVDLRNRPEWLYSFVITFGISLLGLPIVFPLIRSARYSRTNRKILALKEGPVTAKERSHIFLLYAIVLLMISAAFVLLFDSYNIIPYAEAASFLIIFLLIDFVPYRYNDGVLLFYHNREAYYILMLIAIITVILFLINYVASLAMLMIFIFSVFLMLRLRLF